MAGRKVNKKQKKKNGKAINGRFLFPSPFLSLSIVFGERGRDCEVRATGQLTHEGTSPVRRTPLLTRLRD